jgi:hypothetical protein
MKRRGRKGSIEGMIRWTWRTVSTVESAVGGMYVPFSRNSLMLDMRRREEAEGERRMIGCVMGFLVWEGRFEAIIEVVGGRAAELGAVWGALGRDRLLLAR